MKKEELPCDIDAERTILGGIFLNNELFFEDSEALASTDFMLSSHREIFSVIASILYGEIDRVTSADIITISAELNRRGELHRVGGVTYLASLTEGMPRKLSLRDYVGIVKQKAKLRMLSLIGSDLLTESRQNYADADALVDKLQQSITAIEADETGTAVHIGSLTGVIESAIMAGRNLSMDKTEVNLTWGIEALDRKTKGAFYGELTVLGGESAGGKTQAVAQMALENALKGTPVGIWSMEMSKEKFAQRMFTLMSDILTADLMRDPRGMNLHTHVPELRRVSAALAKLPIYIDETSPLTISKFIARVKTATRKYGLELVIADYLQLFDAPGKQEERVPKIMFGCRDYIKTQKKQHMVLLSQFAKEQGLVRGKKRRKGDLYGGAVIHQAAQNVIIVTVENPDKKEPGSDLDVEFMIDKQREGPPGKVMCRRSATSLRYIPAPPEPERKSNEQQSKGNAESKRKPKPSSRGEEADSQGSL